MKKLLISILILFAFFAMSVAKNHSDIYLNNDTLKIKTDSVFISQNKKSILLDLRGDSARFQNDLKKSIEEFD